MNYNICLCFVQHKIVIFYDFMFVLLVFILKNQLLRVLFCLFHLFTSKNSRCVFTHRLFLIIYSLFIYLLFRTLLRINTFHIKFLQFPQPPVIRLFIRYDHVNILKVTHFTKRDPVKL